MLHAHLLRKLWPRDSPTTCHFQNWIQKVSIGHWPIIQRCFREGDEDSNFSVFRVQRFTESPGPLHWINCLSCRNPYQTPPFTELPPPFHWKTLFFTEKRFVASPSQKSAQNNHPRLYIVIVFGDTTKVQCKYQTRQAPQPFKLH